MNPFKTMSSMQQMMGMVSQIKNVMKNPGSMADVLRQRGAINDEVYQKIRGMNPSQIGNYMIENGLIDKEAAQRAYQDTVPHIQGML